MGDEELMALVKATTSRIADKLMPAQSGDGILNLSEKPASRITRTTLSTNLDSGFDESSIYIKTDTLSKPSKVDIPVKAPRPSQDLHLDTRLVKSDKDTTGPGWYDMPATEMTADIKKDLQFIKLRGYVDPKRFYKNDDWKKLPKYFQVGTVVAGAGEFYSARLTKKERAPTLVDQLLKDDQSRKRLKGKFDELQKTKMATKGGRKSFKQRMDKRAGAHKKWARK